MGNLAIVYERIGDFQKALELFEKELNYFENTSYRHERAQSLGNIGNLCKSIGKLDLAIQYHEQSLQINREIGSKLGESRSLCNIGIVYRVQKKYQEAIYFQEKSLEIAQEICSLRDEGMACFNLGNIHLEIGELKAAQHLYEKATTIFNNINEFWGEFYAVGGLAGVLFYQGELQLSLDYCRQQIEFIADLDAPQLKASVLCCMGGISLKKNDFQQAEDYLRESLQIQEETRFQLKSEYDQVSFFDLQVDLYMLLQKSLVLQNKFNEALVVSEKGRSAVMTRALETKAKLLSKNFFSDRINFIDFPNDIQSIKSIAKTQGTVFVEYSFVYSNLYTWIVTPFEQIYFKEIDLSSLEDDESFRDLAYELHKRIDESSWPGNAYYYSQKLYKLIIEPLEDILSSYAQFPIIFVPQHELLFVPFAALQNQKGEFLVEKYTFLISPSIKATELIQDNNPDGLCLVNEPSQKIEHFLIVGNPEMPFSPYGRSAGKLSDLPFAEQEAEAIACMLGSQALVKKEATKANILKRMEESAIIHLATHCLLDIADLNDIPGVIALSSSEEDSGFLTATEVHQLNLRADLVVLSACNTGIGVMRNEGLIGLSRCFLLAGASSVIASYWEIPDSESTKLIMSSFYRNLMRGEEKAGALCKAMRDVMKIYPNNPRMWAGFTLIGKNS